MDERQFKRIVLGFLEWVRPVFHQPESGIDQAGTNGVMEQRAAMSHDIQIGPQFFLFFQPLDQARFLIAFIGVEAGRRLMCPTAFRRLGLWQG